MFYNFLFRKWCISENKKIMAYLGLLVSDIYQPLMIYQRGSNLTSDVVNKILLGFCWSQKRFFGLSLVFVAVEFSCWLCHFRYYEVYVIQKW